MDFSTYEGFSGGAEELAALAVRCAATAGWPVDADKTNERLVRYYVSEGVIDRPDRVGRDASYGYRQLLQLLTARRMAAAGVQLAVIAQHNASTPTAALKQGLGSALPTAAELLVGSFLQQKAAPSTPRSEGRALAPWRPAKPPPSAPSAVDLLDEMRRFRAESIQKLDELDRFRAEVAALRTAAERDRARAEAALQFAQKALEEVSANTARLEQRLVHEMERLRVQVEAARAVLEKREQPKAAAARRARGAADAAGDPASGS
jgi:hypothetical protein